MFLVLNSKRLLAVISDLCVTKYSSINSTNWLQKFAPNRHMHFIRCTSCGAILIGTISK